METDDERRARMRREEIIGRYQRLAKQHDRLDRADKQQRAGKQNFAEQKPRNKGEMIWLKSKA